MKRELLFIFSWINQKTKRLEDIESILNYVYDPRNQIWPMQIREEIGNLLYVLKDESPQNILEIGTANGGTLFMLSHIATKDSKIITIDMPTNSSILNTLFFQSFQKHNQKVFIINEDSHAENTKDKVMKILKGEKVDVLFIDGDHTYEGVKKDFQMYFPLVKQQGLVVFHDIVQGGSNLVGDVPKFWQEIKRELSTQEIVKDWDQGGCGIGIARRRKC
jgi:predicted O-methyltransferase YrrM